jgi:hypothetical protein
MGKAIMHHKIKHAGKAQHHGKSPEYFELGGHKVARPSPYTKANRGLKVEVSK